MSKARAVAIAARRRITLRRLLDKLGPALLAAAAGSVAVVMAGKLTSLVAPLWLAIAAPIGVGGIIALAMSWRSRPSLLDAAVEVDSTLRLRDRVSTALVTDAASDPFAAAAVEQGEQIAAGVRVERSVPVRLGRSWRAWPAVLAAAISAQMFVPDLSPQRRAAAEASRRTTVLAARANEQVESALQAARQELAKPTGGDEATNLGAAASADQLRTLEEIRRELEAATEGRAKPRDPDLAISRAAEAVEQLAQTQKELAQSAREQSEAVADELSRLPAEAGQSAGQMALREALRAGDLEAARRQARELLKPRGPDDPQQRAAAAKELASLAEDLRRLSDAAGKRSDRPTEEVGAASSSETHSSESVGSRQAQPATAGVQDGLPEDARSDPSSSSGPDRARDGRSEADRRATDETRALSERLREAAEAMGASPPKPETATAEQPQTGEPSKGDARSGSQADAKPAPPADGANPPEQPGQRSENDSKPESARADRGESGSDRSPSSGEPSTRSQQPAPQTKPQGAGAKDTGQKDAGDGTSRTRPADSNKSPGDGREPNTTEKGEKADPRRSQEKPREGASGSDSGGGAEAANGRARSSQESREKPATSGAQPSAGDQTKTGNREKPDQPDRARDGSTTAKDDAGAGQKSVPEKQGGAGRDDGKPTDGQPSRDQSGTTARPDAGGRADPSGSKPGDNSNRERPQGGQTAGDGVRKPAQPRATPDKGADAPGTAGESQKPDVTKSTGGSGEGGTPRPSSPPGSVPKSMDGPDAQPRPTGVPKDSQPSGETSPIAPRGERTPADSKGAERSEQKPTPATGAASGPQPQPDPAAPKSGASAAEPSDGAPEQSSAPPRSGDGRDPKGTEPDAQQRSVAPDSQVPTPGKPGEHSSVPSSTPAERGTAGTKEPGKPEPAQPAPQTSSSKSPRPNAARPDEAPRSGDPRDPSKPDVADTASPSGKGEGSHDTPPSAAERRAMERLVEQLGKMANAKDRARGHEQSAERLMQQAQKLYESASPEQRERMARWAQQFGNPSSPSGASEPHGADGPDRRRAGGGGREGRGGDPSGASADPTSRRNGIDPDRTVRTEPVDARPKAGHSGAEPEAGREQVVAEWLGQGSTRRDPTAIAATQDRLREAARSAEQAIGDRTVPSRYDRILREYFNRLPAKFAAPPPGSADAPPGNAVPAPAAAPARDGDESGKP